MVLLAIASLCGFRAKMFSIRLGDVARVMWGFCAGGHEKDWAIYWNECAFYHVQYLPNLNNSPLFLNISLETARFMWLVNRDTALGMLNAALERSASWKSCSKDGDYRDQYQEVVDQRDTYINFIKNPRLDDSPSKVSPITKIYRKIM